MAPRGKSMTVELMIAERREHIARADDYAKEITRLENLKKKVDDFKGKITAEAAELGVELSALGFAKVRAPRGTKEPPSPPKSAGKYEDGRTMWHYDDQVYAIDSEGGIHGRRGRISKDAIKALSAAVGKKVKKAG